MSSLRQSPLGQSTRYPERHDPSLLCPIPRSETRRTSTDGGPGVVGCDIWHAWELSWLNPRGRPRNAVGRFIFDCRTPCLIESKSLKLYLNSIAFTNFANEDAVMDTLRKELSAAAGAAVEVALLPVAGSNAPGLQPLAGESLDTLDIDIDSYGPPDAGLLQAEPSAVASETLVTRLFRANCPVTGQPDWASVQVDYRGPRIDRGGLLRYLVSWRRHSGFHEHCVEAIHADVQARCAPLELTVQACFTRRGGIDINPWRSSNRPRPPAFAREPRQ